MENLGQHKRLRFESRVFALAKDADYPEENQDAIRVDDHRGVAAIADGVSSSLFARLWARLLVEAALDGMPNPDDRESLARWLAELRATWSGQIDVSRLAWFQRPKLREGAFSTLLCVRLVPPGEGSQEGEPSWRFEAVAIGDSCLFHVRDGKLLKKFPIATSAELENDPVVLGSVDLNRDEAIRFHRLDEPCQNGDLVVLCTDAIAGWALRREESGDLPAWETYWNLDKSAWREEILSMRAEREIRCDDATLGLLRITDREPAAATEPDSLGEGLPTPPALPDSLGEGLPTPPALRPEVSGSEGDLRSSERRGQETFAERGGEETSAEHASWTEGLTQGVLRGVDRLKKAGQSAHSKLKNFLDQLREDDR